MKTLSLLTCLMVFSLPNPSASAAMVSATYRAQFTLVNASAGIPGLSVGNGVDITLSYDTSGFTLISGNGSGVNTYLFNPSSALISFSPDGGSSFFSETGGMLGLSVLVDSFADVMTFVNPGNWVFAVVDSTGTALGGSSALPATSADLEAFQIVGTTFQFVGDVDVTGGPLRSRPSFTATGVPEPSAFLFGGIICGVLGIGGLAAKKRLSHKL